MKQKKQNKNTVSIATLSGLGLLGAYFLIGCGGGGGGNPTPTPTPNPSFTPTPNPNGRLEIEGPTGIPCGIDIANSKCTAQTTYTVKAFNGSNQEVALDQSSVTWDTVTGTSTNATAGGKVFSQNLGVSTIRARVNGLEGRKSVRVGFPSLVNITASGLSSGVETGFSADTVDDDNSKGSIAPTTFRWTGKGNGLYSVTTLDDVPVVFKANATQGNFQFQRWTVGGQEVSTNPNLTIDPKNLPAGVPSLDTDPYPALNIVAVYAPRTVTNGEYTPNYLSGVTIIKWNLAQTRVTFSTAGQYSDAKKAKAIEGLNLWKRTTGNNNLFTVIGNDDIANAEVIIAFPTSANSPDTHPGQPGWVTGYTLSNTVSSNTPEGQLGGQAIWTTDATNTVGISRRLIHVYSTDINGIGSITAHEFGHTLGIDGHSATGNDLMNSSVSPSSFPAENDVNAVITLVNRSAAN